MEKRKNVAIEKSTPAAVSCGSSITGETSSMGSILVVKILEPSPLSLKILFLMKETSLHVASMHGRIDFRVQRNSACTRSFKRLKSSVLLNISSVLTHPNIIADILATCAKECLLLHVLVEKLLELRNFH